MRRRTCPPCRPQVPVEDKEAAHAAQGRTPSKLSAWTCERGGGCTCWAARAGHACPEWRVQARVLHVRLRCTLAYMQILFCWYLGWERWVFLLGKLLGRVRCQLCRALSVLLESSHFAVCRPCDASFGVIRDFLVSIPHKAGSSQRMACAKLVDRYGLGLHNSIHITVRYCPWWSMAPKLLRERLKLGIEGLEPNSLRAATRALDSRYRFLLGDFVK